MDVKIQNGLLPRPRENVVVEFRGARRSRIVSDGYSLKLPLYCRNKLSLP
jgi:hypothetical protein